MPFVDIKVYDKKTTNGCRNGEVTLFSRNWGGTVEGCFLGNERGSLNREIITRSQYNAGKNGKNAKYRNESCKSIRAQPSIVMDQIDDKYICGVRGGNTFVNTIRPDYSTGKCPSGYSPCSPMTSPENTVCTDKIDKSDCPITFVQFIEEEDYKNSKYEKEAASYTARKWNDYYLVYSKVKGNDLPYLASRLEYNEPCMIPN